MAGKTAILSVKILGESAEAVKAFATAEEAGEKWEKGLSGLSKGAGLAGAAAGVALTKGFFDAVDIQGQEKRLTDQLGLSPEDSEIAGEVSGKLYADGYGSGLEEVNSAISSVIGNIDGMRGASVEALEEISAKTLNVANTFEQDLGGVTAAVGQMIRTGMADSADEALDIITKGLQSNSRAGDDLLDTFVEYPALFQRLGIDGETATGLISQGLAAGARSTDLVADALKEFQIRATDGSQASAAAFETLGLDAAAMTSQIAAGGKGASDGLNLVLASLRGMTDPVAQNAAAVGIFGTQAEDLGAALFALDPSSAVAALGEVTGAAEKLGTTDAETALTSFGRSMQTTFSDVAAAAIPVITPILDGLKEFAPILGPLAVAAVVVAGAVGAVSAAMAIYEAVQTVQTVAQWANNAAWLASPVTWIILAIIAAIALLVAAVLFVIENHEEMGRVIADVWNGFIGWLEDLGRTAQDVFNNVINWVQDLIRWLRQLAMDVVPGWLQDMLGMGAFRASVDSSSSSFSRQAIDLGVSRMAFTQDAAFPGLAVQAAAFDGSALSRSSAAPVADLGGAVRPYANGPQQVTNITVTVNGALDKDGTARAITGVLNDYYAQNGTTVAGGRRRL